MFVVSPISAAIFQLTRPVWGEPFNEWYNIDRKTISTHSPRVGRTRYSLQPPGWGDNFNSLAPCGANPTTKWCKRPLATFQLTRPVWGEPVVDGVGVAFTEFQLTRPVWGEPDGYEAPVPDLRISTHSPRVGRTHRQGYEPGLQLHFNSLAPCGANLCIRRVGIVNSSFQLTRPVWGEPDLSAKPSSKDTNFNSLAPCGANPIPFNISLLFDNFNSLAPCGANLYILYICRLFAATWGGQ